MDTPYAKIFAISINQGVEKILESSGAQGTSLVIYDLALGHKSQVPVIANRRGKIRVWVSNPDNEDTSAQVSITLDGATNYIETKTINVKFGNPDIYGFNSGGGVAEFDLNDSQIAGSMIRFTASIVNARTATSVVASHVLTTPRKIRIFMHLFKPDYSQPGDTPVLPHQMTELANKFKDRIRAYFPTSWEGVTVQMVPADFPQLPWAWQKEGGLLGSITEEGRTVAKNTHLFNKWSIHVRRYMNGHPTPANTQDFYFLVIKAQRGFSVPSHSDSVDLGISWKPDKPGDAHTTPACMGWYIYQVNGFTMGKSLINTVDRVFIHELGHAHGSDHVASTTETLTPSTPYDWPGTRGITTWVNPGKDRYGDGRVGVPGYDFDRNIEIPFVGRDIKYSVMGYVTAPWTSDYHWVQWSKFNSIAQFDYSSESSTLCIAPTDREMWPMPRGFCPNIAPPVLVPTAYRGMVVFGSAVPTGSLDNTFPNPRNRDHELPVRWDHRNPLPGSSLRSNPPDVFMATYQPPTLLKGVENIVSEPINYDAYPSTVMRIHYGEPSLVVNNKKLFVNIPGTDKQTSNVSWSWNKEGTDTLDGDYTEWKCNDGSVDLSVGTEPGLSSSRCGTTTFTAGAAPGSYEIQAVNPGSACQGGGGIKATIEVRKVVLTITSPAPSSPQPLKAGSTFPIQASTNGTGYSNKLKYFLDPGAPGSVDENSGKVKAGPLAPGSAPVPLVVHVVSEDPRVKQDVEFLVSP